MPFVRDPHRRHFLGTQELGERNRVTPIGLNPLARPSRDQRRRNHHAVVAERADQSTEP
jgi:hypothetical protein